MANEEQVRILRQGAWIWNTWREDNPGIKPDLRRADLRGRPSSNRFVRNAELDEAINHELSEMRNFEFEGSDIALTDLRWANLSGVDLSEADLGWSDLRCAKLNDANLRDARLDHAQMVDTNVDGAVLTGCTVFGISAWDLKGSPKDQSNLIISRSRSPTITVDNIELAQFINILLNSAKIRQVIDTITSKVVLILGSFTPDRKVVLDAIREELRKRDFVPVLFDFEKPDSRDLTETVLTLARMSRFIIADITDPRCIPLELQSIIPDLAVPVQPILLEGTTEFGMFRDLKRKYHWVLPVFVYKDLDDLFSSLGGKVIAPAEAKVKELKMV